MRKMEWRQIEDDYDEDEDDETGAIESVKQFERGTCAAPCRR